MILTMMARGCSFPALLLCGVCLYLCIVPSVQFYVFWYSANSGVNPDGPLPSYFQSVTEVTACGGKGGTRTLECGDGKHIKILGALYGRIGNECSDGVIYENQNCKGDQEVTEALVKGYCEGKTSCKVRVKDARKNLDNPCENANNNKYLKVAYKCE